MLEIRDLWISKNTISQSDTVATAGSCFAQHISRAMIQNGFHWIDAEPAPDHLSDEDAKAFGYGVFSFRTGNIYTATLLRQWVEAAFNVTPLDEELWEHSGRIFDPMRPAIEMNGFASTHECLALRRHSLHAMRNVLSNVDLFVFTLGLTESWRNRDTGFVYAACPGTLAGSYSEAEHEFYNQTYPEIFRDMQAVLDLIREHNPKVKFLLTVSPVPLVATAAQQHVLLSTTYSKSVLRAVAGDLATLREDTDYFPSFEIINSTPFRGSFFMPNQREVSSAGVDFVMKHFFAGLKFQQYQPEVEKKSHETGLIRDSQIFQADREGNDIQCEEALLEAFSK
ncbi:GSCFA domain-containing protein [Pseudodonghicola flavimaris]|uniref:GSCFA domain-containing protein n=1 Tax=Pseudodonghicola flavimaris TaxID=3050036 RepID=A0ABT7EZ41_9RHOB|nr:GSCFA domain-containing protein [Pseudodonghicola flavimaris]MDK3017634.1 GSCFA domain-containing protein [Pseudodonghicola flavimaris]